MIPPGNSRQVIFDAIADCPLPPHATSSKIVGDLCSAGYGIVPREELIDILTGLITIIKDCDETDEMLTDMRVAKAIALRDLLAN